jgi:hypothetical protein
MTKAKLGKAFRELIDSNKLQVGVIGWVNGIKGRKESKA